MRSPLFYSSLHLDRLGLRPDSNGETHNTEPDLEILKRLADYFDTTIDYLVGYSDQRYKVEHLTEERLTPREARLLAGLRALPEEKRQCVEQVIRLFSSEKE